MLMIVFSMFLQFHIAKPDLAHVCTWGSGFAIPGF